MKKVLFYLLFILCINEQAFSQNFTSGESYTYTKVYLDSVKSTIPNQNAQSIQTVQYKDGLGRIKQDIAINAIKPGQDIVTSYFYGINGEIAKQYLPIAKGSQNGLLHNISEGEIEEILRRLHEMVSPNVTMVYYLMSLRTITNRIVIN